MSLTCAEEPLLRSEPWDSWVESEGEEGENEVEKKERKLGIPEAVCDAHVTRSEKPVFRGEVSSKGTSGLVWGIGGFAEAHDGDDRRRKWREDSVCVTHKQK